MRPVHIFLLVATLTACYLSSCQTARQATPRTLILFYDPAIGPAPLLHTAERCEATLVYHYETLHGVALSVPRGKSLRRTTRRLRRTEGVLSVQPDRQVPLH